MTAETPRVRGDYVPEDVEQVKSACLTIVSVLGAYLDGLCIVGGLVPLLLIDLNKGPGADESAHPGSNDLDVGLSIALLDDGRYEEIRDALRSSGFEPDTSEGTGNIVSQRWKKHNLKVMIDWLIEATPENPPASMHHLEGDFGAIAMRGIELALNERVMVSLDGYTLDGNRLERDVPVCGPGAFVVLKALAIANRDKPKDCYDTLYVIHNYAGAPATIVEALAHHAEIHPALVREALEKLATDFASPEHQGPQYVVEFDGLTGDEADQAAADAQGYVDDMLNECRQRGLL